MSHGNCAFNFTGWNATAMNDFYKKYRGILELVTIETNYVDVNFAGFDRYAHFKRLTEDAPWGDFEVLKQPEPVNPVPATNDPLPVEVTTTGVIESEEPAAEAPNPPIPVDVFGRQ